MGKQRKDPYRWTCTACGHAIENRPDGRDYEALDSASRGLMEAAAEHLASCDAASFEDVDGYYRPEASCNPHIRPVVRRVRKIALVRFGKNKTLHIHYDAEHVPCGLEVAQPHYIEVSVADFFGGRLPKYRLCKACVAYRRPGIAEEMAVLELQFSGSVERLKN